MRSPLPPTTPNPALRQPSLTVLRNKSAVLLPPLCRAAVGVRTPAVPRRRGTSARPASELPPLRDGDLLRALPRLHQQGSRFISSNKWHVIPECSAEKKVAPPIDSVRCAGESLTSGEKNLLNKGRIPFVRKLGRGIFFCRWMADNSRQTISRKSLICLKTEKVTFYRSKGNLHAEGDAPRRATRKPKKIPPAQQAGARRRSPQRGSAVAGAHITRA